MKIPCFRCGKEIETPNASNADYIIAQDTAVREQREVLLILKHNQATLDKVAKMEETETYLDEDGITKLTRLKYPGLKIEDNEYDEEEIPDFQSSKRIVGLIKVKTEVREKDVQKTGIICPKCYKKTDKVIWGVHKEG